MNISVVLLKRYQTHIRRKQLYLMIVTDILAYSSMFPIIEFHVAIDDPHIRNSQPGKQCKRDY